MIPHFGLDDSSLVEVLVGLLKTGPGMKVLRYKSKKPCAMVNENAKKISSLGYSNLGLSYKIGGVIEKVQENFTINTAEIDAIRSRQSP